MTEALLLLCNIKSFFGITKYGKEAIEATS
jgi:hypothetical protein